MKFRPVLFDSMYVHTHLCIRVGINKVIDDVTLKSIKEERTFLIMLFKKMMTNIKKNRDEILV